MIRWTTLQFELIKDPKKLGYAEALVGYNEPRLRSMIRLS